MASQEAHPYVTDPGARIDVLAQCGRVFDHIDVAITNPLRPDMRSTALRGSGECATSYEAVKVQRYGRLVRDLGPDNRLVPFVVDVFGGLGRSARTFLSSCAVALARITGDHVNISLQLLFSRVQSAVSRGIGRLVAKALVGAGRQVEPVDGSQVESIPLMCDFSSSDSVASISSATPVGELDALPLDVVSRSVSLSSVSECDSVLRFAPSLLLAE